jgi:hypothetical protein
MKNIYPWRWHCRCRSMSHKLTTEMCCNWWCMNMILTILSLPLSLQLWYGWQHSQALNLLLWSSTWCIQATQCIKWIPSKTLELLLDTKNITSHSSSFNGLAVAATLAVSYNLLCYSHENLQQSLKISNQNISPYLNSSKILLKFF